MELPPPKKTLALAEKLLRHTVLMVEDDPADMLFQTEILLSLGLSVVTITCGEAAMSHLRADYQLAIIDLGLPGMTGLEVARKIRAEWPTLPIVISTGDATSADAAKAALIDRVMVEQKPLTAERLKLILRTFKVIP